MWARCSILRASSHSTVPDPTSERVRLPCNSPVWSRLGVLAGCCARCGVGCNAALRSQTWRVQCCAAESNQTRARAWSAGRARTPHAGCGLLRLLSDPALVALSLTRACSHPRSDSDPRAAQRALALLARAKTALGFEDRRAGGEPASAAQKEPQ
eukprot:1857259-Rhodomonas_salina.1